jgi:hypothetical protein
MLRIGLGKWSEGSQSRKAVKYGRESRGTLNKESLCWREPAALQQSVRVDLFLAV